METIEHDKFEKRFKKEKSKLEKEIIINGKKRQKELEKWLLEDDCFTEKEKRENMAEFIFNENRQAREYFAEWAKAGFPDLPE
jgi:hypothetical protein